MTIDDVCSAALFMVGAAANLQAAQRLFSRVQATGEECECGAVIGKACPKHATPS